MSELGDTADGLLPAGEFAKTLGSLESKASPRLRQLFVECDPNGEHEDHLVVLEKIGRFVVAGPHISGPDHPALSRLRLLVEALERIPNARMRFTKVVRSVLEKTRAIKLLGEAGLPNSRGLWAETTDRLAKRFLPEAPAPYEMSWLMGKIIRSNADIEWLDEKADPLFLRLVASTAQCWEPLRVSVIDAITMITTRIAALGMNEAFRTRTGQNGIRDSPLYHLTRARPTEMPALIEASRRHLEQVKEHLEQRGVSIDVVYALDSIEHGLRRIEILLPFADPEDEMEPTHEIREVIEAFGRGLVGNRSFRQLMSDNMRLLARKVIERAGRTGEHYVTSSRREYFKMLASAAGGGFLTCGTAMARYFVKWGHFAPFIDGIFASVVYAGSFLVMQLVGFTLATKQPSMTAAALAGTIRDKAGPGRLDELVPLISRMARSQFAAAVGNVSAVIITCTIVDLLWRSMTGHTFLDDKDSIKFIQSIDPFASLTILFAAFTGVLLWISSLVAGWFENWVVYRRLPEAIEHNRFADSLGRNRMSRLARLLENQSAGFGGSIALGILLGMIPPIAKFMGLGTFIDVRHITLSSGSLTFAYNSIGVEAAGGWGTFVRSCAGIAFIGLMNFGVSFTLALIVALRARDVPKGERRLLPGAVLRRLAKHPLEFFYPPKDAPGTPAHDHHH